MNHKSHNSWVPSKSNGGVIPECNDWLVPELVWCCEEVSSCDSVRVLGKMSIISPSKGWRTPVSLKSSNRLCAGNSTVMERAPLREPNGVPWSNNTVNKTRSGSTTAQALRLMFAVLVLETSVNTSNTVQLCVQCRAHCGCSSGLLILWGKHRWDFHGLAGST